MATAGQDHNYKKVEIAGPMVDPYSKAVVTITEPHAMCHNGYMFHASGKATGLADTASAKFTFKTPAGSYPHFNRVILNFSRGDVDVTTFEDSVVSVLGAAVPRLNTNRNSANTPLLEIYSGSTVTTPGLALHTLWAVPTLTGQGAKALGISDITNGEEWVMKPSTLYTMVITNNSGGVLDYSFECLWYELQE